MEIHKLAVMDHVKTLLQAEHATWPSATRLAFGLVLMSVALLWHPIGVERFLLQAVLAPLDTLFETHTRTAAMLFWLSVAVLGWSLVGILRHTPKTARSAAASQGAAPLEPNDHGDAGAWFV